jgi:hypothetical protein
MVTNETPNTKIQIPRKSQAPRGGILSQRRREGRGTQRSYPDGAKGKIMGRIANLRFEISEGKFTQAAKTLRHSSTK